MSRVGIKLRHAYKVTGIALGCSKDSVYATNMVIITTWCQRWDTSTHLTLKCALLFTQPHKIIIFIKCFLCAKHCTKHFTGMFSFDLHSQPTTPTPPDKWRSWGLGRQPDFPGDTAVKGWSQHLNPDFAGSSPGLPATPPPTRATACRAPQARPPHHCHCRPGSGDPL